VDGEVVEAGIDVHATCTRVYVERVHTEVVDVYVAEGHVREKLKTHFSALLKKYPIRFTLQDHEKGSFTVFLELNVQVSDKTLAADRRYASLSKQLDKQEAIRREANDKAAVLRQEAYKTIVNSKSKTVGCKGCGSSISRKHLRDPGPQPVKCPVCGGVLNSKTNNDRVEALIKKREAATEKIQELKQAKLDRRTRLAVKTPGK